MKNIYIPGLATTHEQLDQIEQLFKDGGIKIEPLFGDYRLLAKMSAPEIAEAINLELHLLVGSKEANVIGHSFGCNLCLLAQQHFNFQKMVLVSPEFKSVTKEEKRQIQAIAHTKYASEEQPSSSKRNLKEQLLLWSLFLRSKKWVSHQCSSIDIPTMVAFSEGDSFVSMDAVDVIPYEEVVMLETAFHNPFLSEEGPTLVKKIKQFLDY